MLERQAVRHPTIMAVLNQITLIKCRVQALSMVVHTLKVLLHMGIMVVLEVVITIWI